jgi:putative Ca2+/H+ antiporter (TMEM165/GDT1 family)
MDWKLLASTFGVIFLAELGDKTQLACIMLAADSRKTWTVFLGASLALVTVTLIGVIFAQFICQFVPAHVIKKIASVGFIVLGVLIFMDKL